MADDKAFSIHVDDGSGPTTPHSGSGPSHYDLPLETGAQVGEYVVEGQLGSGGFGAVYRGVHPVIGKSAAIKVLSVRYASDPNIVSRFVSEARAVNKIGHRNIIDIFSFGTLPDGRPYYVMELLDGMTLLDLIRQRGRLTVAETLAILEPIGDAIDAAHNAGVAHRDLKPENIFLVRDGAGFKPKLLDFGVAKLMDENLPRDHRTQTGATLGTPAYMAPEQCIGRSVDHRADVYALGVVTFEMLTGALPFGGETQFEIMSAHVNLSAPFVHERVPEVPIGVSETVRWMLEKDREQRPRNLAQAMAALRATSRGEKFARQSHSDTMPERPAPSLASSVGPISVAPAPVSTAKWKIAVPIALAVAAIAGTAAVLLSKNEAQPAPIVAAAPPATIEVTLRGLPADAKLSGTRGEALANPVRVEKNGAQTSIFVDADGYTRREVKFAADRDQTIEVALEAKAQPAAVAPAPAPPPQKQRSRVLVRSGNAEQPKDGKQKINELEPWE